MSLKLNVIIASTRPGRNGPKVGKWVADYAKANSDFEVELVDLADFDLPLLDEPNHPRMQKYEHEHTKRWSEANAHADAFVFVTPEYDYTPAASFINAVQTLHNEWHYKPAGIVSYGGVSGGLRAMQTEKLLLTAVSMMPIPQEVPVPFFSKMIDEDGVFTPTEPVEEGAKLMLAELHKWASALRPIRQEERRKAA